MKESEKNEGQTQLQFPFSPIYQEGDGRDKREQGGKTGLF